MDPDLCLDRLMAAVREGDLEAAREHMSGLDEWLSKKGFLPRRWARSEITIREEDLDKDEDAEQSIRWVTLKINGVPHHVELVEVTQTETPKGSIVVIRARSW